MTVLDDIAVAERVARGSERELFVNLYDKRGRILFKAPVAKPGGVRLGRSVNVDDFALTLDPGHNLDRTGKPVCAGRFERNSLLEVNAPRPARER